MSLAAVAVLAAAVAATAAPTSPRWRPLLSPAPAEAAYLSHGGVGHWRVSTAAAAAVAAPPDLLAALHIAPSCEASLEAPGTVYAAAHVREVVEGRLAPQSLPGADDTTPVTPFFGWATIGARAAVTCGAQRCTHEFNAVRLPRAAVDVAAWLSVAGGAADSHVDADDGTAPGMGDVGPWILTAHAVRCGDAPPASAALAIDATGAMAPTRSLPAGRWRASVRAMTYNVWNVNPPAWVWGNDPLQRMRQYAFRMYHLGDMLRRPAADILALQEVRLDTTLGGTDPAALTEAPASAPLPLPSQHEPATTYTAAVNLATLWYNRTRSISENPRFHERNEGKWRAVHEATKFVSWVAGHPYEDPWRNDTAGYVTTSTTTVTCTRRNVTVTKCESGAGGEPPRCSNATTSTEECATAVTEPRRSGGDLRSPYAVSMPRGLALADSEREAEGGGVLSYDAMVRRLVATSHAQIAHLAAHLPDHDFAGQPGQLYLDEDAWRRGERQRDEEGPAIFAPRAHGGGSASAAVVAADYLLLSRDSSDDGDGHQRVCLHAVVDLSHLLRREGEVAAAERAPAGSLLVDVYTVHLALSERARNRTVPELLAFIRDSAVGQVQLLMGDLNAEPHEPAMRAIVDGNVVLCSQPVVAATPSAIVPAGIDASVVEDAAPATRVPAATCGTAADAVAAIRLQRDSSSAGGVRAEAAVASGAEGRAAPHFRDVWRDVYGEPTPGDGDAATRRYAFTFPSDNPVKRIDYVFVAAAEGPGGGAAAQVATQRVWVHGQDPLPGTEMYEGRGTGMQSQMSPLWPSDHRAVVAELAVALG